MSEKSKPKPDNIGWVFFFIVTLLLSFAPLVVHAQTVETRSPTSNWAILGNWLDPTYAYSSDGNYAYAPLNAKRGYGNYGFNLADTDEITKVEVGFEWHYSSGGIGGYVSWDLGAYWDFLVGCPFTLDTLQWIDVTGETEWTSTKLDDSHLATMVSHQTGTGCYGLDAEVGLWNGSLIKVRDVKIGDILTGWNQTEIEIEEKGQNETLRLMSKFVPTKVINATLHEGYWDLIQIISGNVLNASNRKDVLVTLNHTLPFIEEIEEIEGKFKVKIGEKEAGEFVIGDKIFGFMSSGYYNETTGDLIPHFQVYEVNEINPMNTTEGVMDIQTETRWFMGHYLLARKEPWTGYVDWLPVRVTTTALAPSIAVFFIGALVFFAFVGSLFYLGLKRKR